MQVRIGMSEISRLAATKVKTGNAQQRSVDGDEK
jgi:hypothetical protein